MWTWTSTLLLVSAFATGSLAPMPFAPAPFAPALFAAEPPLASPPAPVPASASPFADDLEWLDELREAFRRGGTYRSQGDLAEYLEEFPGSPGGHHLAAAVAFDRGRLDEAAEHIERGGLAGTVLGGRLLLRLGRYEEALALARSGATGTPVVSAADTSRLAAAVLEVEALAGLGRLGEARAHAREVTDAIDDRTLGPYGLMDLARLLVVQRRFELAAQALVFADADLNGRQGASYRLAEPEVLVLLGEVYARTRQDGKGGPDPTLAVLNEVLDVDDQHVAALTRKAEVYLYGHNGRAADAALARALERDPTDAAARFLWGKMALVDRRATRALEAADLVLDVNPREVRALALRAAALEVSADAGAFEARAAFETAHPESALLDLLLGEVLQSHYRFAESVVPLERALERDPFDESPLPILAQSLAHLGREDEALAALHEHFRRSPYPYPWRHNMIEVLEALADHVDVVEEGRWRLRVPPGEQDVLGPLLRERLDVARADMAERWGVDPDGEVLVEVFDEHADFSVRTVGFAGFGALGACFGRVVTMLSPLCEMRGNFHWAQTAVHEYAHVVTLELSRHRVPRWLTEGISVIEEKRVDPAWARELERPVLDARANGMLRPLESLDAAFRDGRTVILGYYQGSLICEVIERDFGFDALRRLVAAYAEGADTATAVERTLGIELTELDRRFERYLDEVVAVRARLRPRYGEEGKEALRHRVKHGDDGALVPLAMAYHDLGRETDRDAALSRALTRLGETPELLRALAERDVEDGRFELALERLVRWRDEAAQPDADGFALLASVAEQLGDDDLALASLEQARDLFPGDVAAGSPTQRLHGRYVEAGRDDDARALLVEICRVDETALMARLTLAEHAESEGDLDSAAAYYGEAVAIDPYLPEVRLAFADVLIERGEREAAERQWRLVLAMRADQMIGGEHLDTLQAEARAALERGP